MRNRGLNADGWLVVRFAWEHVMPEPEYVDRVRRSVVLLLSRKPLGRALDDEHDGLTA
ncbi:MAG TPA: hypothetical protein VK204_17655 [Nocardioidaceae bacterium]|jgi:very-short-patch-repair endonuclease|nr:hypothetical protein [Nocardioidaceae bacterium]